MEPRHGEGIEDDKHPHGNYDIISPPAPDRAAQLGTRKCSPPGLCWIELYWQHPARVFPDTDDRSHTGLAVEWALVNPC